ncbi:MAG TPA: redoxin domain-containing protein [Steroidobacteraceae bacterium]|nr:redoxin domain-containing protein [Steroidobacteraceae bacterium]
MNRWTFVAIVVAAGLSGAGGYWFLGREAPSAVPAVNSPSTGALPQAAPPRLAETVPDFKLTDREGALRSLKDWHGKSLIVNFWATWCAPCRREIPLLQRIARERAADGFEVVGIAVDFRDKVLAYADEMKIEYPLLIGEQDALDAAAAFGVEAIGFPFTIFTDKQGHIVAAHMGELHAEEAELILDQVAAVNAGEQSPAEARQLIEAATRRQSAVKNQG